MTVTVRELSHEEIYGTYPLIKQLNPEMTEETFRARLTQMLIQNYRCAAAFNAEGECLGIAGFRAMTRFWCGSHVDLDNVVIDERFRKQGAGKKLIEWIENWGREHGHSFAVLASYTHNIDSHRFYYREGYVIRGFYFTKDL